MVNADQHRQDPEPDRDEERVVRQDRRKVYKVGRNIEWLCDPEFTAELAQYVVKERQCTS
jgi:hypothetical protein